MKLKRTDADTTEELPEEIKAGYERTIKKCSKLVDVYPKRKRWHDDALFLKAKATYYINEFPPAIRRFRQFQKEFPESPYIPESYLYLGKAYLEDDNLQKAEETFRFIMEEYPKLNESEEITLLLAEVAIKREGKSQAILILEESLKSVKSDERKMDIILKLSGLYIDLKLYHKAAEVLLSAPRNKDFQDCLFQIDYNILICYKMQNKYDQAISLANKMLKNNQYLRQAPKVLLEKGIVLKMMGEIKKAIKVFEEITEGTGPNHIRGKAWYELALIYQHEFGDFEKAKECYQQVISLSSDEGIQEIAQNRIQGIDRRQEYINGISGIKDSKKKADTTDSANLVLYKLGEIYWLNLSEPDSALNQFATIISDTVADSLLVMKSMYARAWILRFIKQDTVFADSLYNVIINRYPATIIAQKSQQDIGIPVTVKTRDDSARIAFIEAERLYFDERNAVAAVNAYYKVAKKFADNLAIASESIYAAAWLCDNVLNKNKKALVLYKKLCDSYPESDLCLNEAKPRIKIVEDTLKLIELQKKKEDAKKYARKGKKKKAKKDKTDDSSSEELLLSEEADTADKVITKDTVSTTQDSAVVKEEEVQEKQLSDEPK